MASSVLLLFLFATQPVSLFDGDSFDGWEYKIRCQGQRIQLWINGRQTVDYREPDDSIERRGLIGPQIHGGPPSEAWYKDIVIQELDSK